MGFKSFLASAALIASAAAQNFATYSDNSGRSLSVSIPENTAQSGTSGSIFLQIGVPSGTQWLAFGSGTGMTNANMFVVYSDGTNPVLSMRQATGHVMPNYNSSMEASILSGSGIQSDGSMVVNIRCDTCLSWKDGSMSPTSSSSNWVMAYKSGNALGSNSPSASIQQHDNTNSFTMDLTKGIGGNSQNPFVASAASSSASGSNTASATGGSSPTASSSSTSGISQPIASTVAGNSGSSSSTSSSNNTDMLRLAHGILMCVLFLGCFPFFAMTLYLPTANKVRFIHAPLQGLSIILLIVAMALGISLGTKINELDTYHQIIGFIVVFVLVLVQPVMGVLQHLHFHKTGGRSVWGPVHQGVGRGIIALGVVNGGLGFQVAGNTSAYVPYAVVSVIVFLIYGGVVAWSMYTAKSRRSVPIDKENKSPNGYEMHNTHRRLHSGNAELTNVEPKHDRV